LFGDAQINAANTLDRLDRELGKEGQALCRAVLAQGLFFNQIAATRGLAASERVLKYFGARFRECLETLAVALGYAAKVNGNGGGSR
jgi:hypothetical protein